jgi:hypothetical protein
LNQNNIKDRRLHSVVMKLLVNNLRIVNKKEYIVNPYFNNKLELYNAVDFNSLFKTPYVFNYNNWLFKNIIKNLEFKNVLYKELIIAMFSLKYKKV